MSLAPGSLLGAYEVLSALGAGGMGEVYRARDSRLERDVALKVLPPDMVADPARLERFAREARALAALNHPHIVTIYSTEDADGIRFLTMELVEGRSLDRVIPETGLPIAPLLDIALQLCDAIATAHEKQLTHRDLKPANVMVSDAGRVKVLDFGLASFGKSAPQQPDVTRMELTHQGTVLGTAPYMSPEQVEGKPLDHRTDIFSLGIMLYEMAAGRRPFQGDSSPALMSSILKDTPPALREVRSDVPPEFARVVARCLEKDPRDRIQTARDVFNDLKLLRRELTSDVDSRVVQRPRARISTGVAPFTVSAADEISVALANALVEDIASGLGRFSYVSLVADPAAARYVVSGSIRRAGNALRVSAHLLDRDYGTQIWTETYNRQATEDIFALQDDLSTRIASTVADAHGVLVRSMAATLTDRPYDQLTATELSLRYHVYLEQFRPEEHARLRAAFEHVLTREPHHADGWAALSRLYEHEYSHGLNPQPDAQERHRKAADRAVEINPLCQAGWEAMASFHFFNRDRAALRDAVDRVVSLNPLSGSALGFMGIVLAWSGDWDRGVEIIRRVMEYNPHHAGWYFFVTATNFYRLGQFEESLSESKRVNMPHLPWTHVGIAVAAGQLGRRADAQLGIEGIKRTLPAMLDLDFARAAWAGWFWEDDFVELHMDGLRKALALVETPLDSLPRHGTPSASVEKATSDAVAPRPSAPSPSGVESGRLHSDAGRLKLTTAVARFTVQGQDGEAGNIADGLGEEVMRGLARFFYLSVVSNTAAARYVVSGSVRRAGNTVRVGAQLVDTTTGEHLWTETYTREFREDLLTLIDDVTDRIVATTGDVCGALMTSMVRTIRHVPVSELSPAELVLRNWGFQHRPAAEEHAQLREAAEAAVARGATERGLFAMLSHLYCAEFALYFNPLPDPLGRALRAARREIDLDRSNELGWEVLALTSFYARDRNTFFAAADQALSLNPRNANTTAWMGNLLTHAGEYDRGAAITERAKALNPQHPGWYHFAAFARHLHLHQFEEALLAARRANMPDFFWSHFAVATAAGHLKRSADARVAFDAMVELAPPLADPAALRDFLARWYWEDEMIDLIADGMAAARAATISRPSSSPDQPQRTTAPQSDPGSAPFLIAVGQIRAVTSDRSAHELADSLTDGIVTRLSRFSYLRVGKQRSSESDTASSGYRIEGSVRAVGQTSRVAIQLIDAATGASIWADAYDRQFSTGDELALQDALADTIVATIADANGALVRSMTGLIRNKAVHELTPYEAVLRALAYVSLLSPQEHATVVAALTHAVEQAPGYADAWAVLAMMYIQGRMQGFDERPEVVEQSMAAVRRALEIAPTNQHAHFALAVCHHCQGDRGAFRAAAERAIALNPLDAFALPVLGALIAYGGDWERGLALVERAMQLNPHHSSVYRMPFVVDHYRRGDYAGALALLDRVNMPSFPSILAARAALLGQLGRTEEARALYRQAQASHTQVSPLRSHFFTPALAEQLADGLRKAGIEP